LNETFRANGIIAAVAMVIYLEPTSDQLYDVNLTPDKRRIVIEAEAQLIEALNVCSYICIASLYIGEID